MTPEIKDWFDYSRTDLEVAKHLANTYSPEPVEIICYHCQQASEKAVKALILFFMSEDSMPKIHDITFLLNQLKSKIKIDAQLYECARKLTKYAVIARYPSDMKMSLDQSDEAIKCADTICNWANSLIED